MPSREVSRKPKIPMIASSWRPLLVRSFQLTLKEKPRKQNSLIRFHKALPRSSMHKKFPR
jgi:hypothetical protein